MTTTGWLSVAKSSVLKSSTIGAVGVLGMYWGTPQKERRQAAYPFCFAVTSGVYAVNNYLLTMRSEMNLIQDMPRMGLAVPRQVLTNPSVAIPVAFGAGFFVFPLAYSYTRVYLQAEQDRTRN